MSVLDHEDLCLSVLKAGGSIYYVAESMIRHLIPPPFKSYDLPFFLLRWSEDWNRASLEHFARKWKLPVNDPTMAHSLVWAAYHRQLALSHVLWPLGKIAGFLWYHGAGSAGRALAQKLEAAVTSKRLAQRLIALGQSRN
jgi:hypothetical protein